MTTETKRAGWLETDLGWSGFRKKFLYKAFPVHPSFFLGEIALFSFITLVITGIYLSFSYEPSARLITVGGAELPAAYASVTETINQQPFGLIARRVHHWSAHLMIAAVILHLLRVFFSGTFRKPRQVNWYIGCVLLFVTILAAFSGYLLPYDEFAVTATGIGYGIAHSIPWVGPEIAEFVFAGKFPALGTVPRFYGYHVMLLPLLLIGIIGLHMMIMIKQKHSEPSYNRDRAPKGELLGIPLWPQQVTLMFELFLFMTAGVLLLAATFPVHPVEVYGPPGPETPSVKPDWYFLWIYGMLKLIPGWIHLELWGGVINAEVIGSIVLPGLIVAVMVFAPLFSREREPQHYMEPVVWRPMRTSVGIAALALLLTLSVAAYEDVLRVPLSAFQLAAVLVPLGVWAASYAILRALKRQSGEPEVGAAARAPTGSPGKE